MKVSYRHAASDDLVRQFRYYLVTQNIPDVALRFRDAVRITVKSLQHHPYIGSRYPLRNPELRDLRFWPVAGFKDIGIYYLADRDNRSRDSNSSRKKESSSHPRNRETPPAMSQDDTLSRFSATGDGAQVTIRGPWHFARPLDRRSGMSGICNP